MAFVLQILFGVLNTFLRGVLIKTFWGWFILTQFHGLPDLSIIGAIGLSLFVSAVSPWRSLSREEIGEDRDDAVSRGLINSFLYFLACLFSLGVGWIVHSMM
jgi:hypothetical protein